MDSKALDVITKFVLAFNFWKCYRINLVFPFRDVFSFVSLHYHFFLRSLSARRQDYNLLVFQFQELSGFWEEAREPV